MSLESIQEESSQKDLSSNVQSVVLTTRKRNRHGEVRKDEDQVNGKTKTKRARKPLTLQERLAIITCWNEGDMTVKEIGIKFGVPRTTVHGIIKNRDALAKSQLHEGLTLKRFSRAESRFRILEELLVAWSLELASRGVNVTNQKITAQAFEIHRMLSGLLSKPLQPCAFSPGWFRKFKERRSNSLMAIQGDSSTSLQDDGWFFPEEHLKRFSCSLDDIYTCGVTSMHMNMLPKRTFDDSCQDSGADMQDSPIVSVLLCCNASGTDKRSLHILGKYTHCTWWPINTVAIIAR